MDALVAALSAQEDRAAEAIARLEVLHTSRLIEKKRTITIATKSANQLNVNFLREFKK